MPALEQTRLSALNAARYRKQTISQELRGNLLANSQSTDSEQEEDAPSRHKFRLAMLKAGAIKEANKQGGAYLGSTVGGFVGSAVPVLGTGVGAFIGRYVGKKMGITGIIIMVILMILFNILIYIAVLKGACDYAGKTGQWWVGAREVCKALGS